MGPRCCKYQKSHQPRILHFFELFLFFDGLEVRCNRRRDPRDRFDFPSLSFFGSFVLFPAFPRACDLSASHSPGMSTMTPSPTEYDSSSAATRQTYKVHKRRFWGLAQLVLLNIVVSWDVGHLPPDFAMLQPCAHHDIVAHILVDLNDRREVFPGLRECHQLAEHRIPLCVLHRKPVSNTIAENVVAQFPLIEIFRAGTASSSGS